MNENISRRSFITASATAAIGAAAAAPVILAAENDIVWNDEADLVILGTGAGGLCAAIEAGRAGVDTLVLEKACQEDEGGNTRVSGNMWTVPLDDKAPYFEYIHAASERDVDDEYLHALVDGQFELNDFLSGIMYAQIKTSNDGFSPEFAALPGGEQVRAYSMGGGTKLWLCLRAEVDEYDTVRIRYETPGVRLITNVNGEVIGVVAVGPDGEINVKARKGVILATGGYEYDPYMIQNSYPGWPVCSRGTPYNTGDGIKMAQKVGAGLWHMNASDSGTGGIFCPGIDFGHGAYDSDKVPANFSLTKASAKRCGFIYVNKHGKRFMPEDRPDGHGYGRREYLFFYDGVACEWPQLPAWCVFDAAEAAAGAVASASATGAPSESFTWFASHSCYQWSPDNSAEVEKGWLIKADTIEDLAAQMNEWPDGEGKMDAATLAATIEEYNGFVAAGEDPLGRSIEVMRTLEGPWYAVPVYPNQYNTQGGPRRNTNAQTLDAFGEVIPRLYNVGECGAGYGWVYNGGWNNAEAMVTGRWAAKHAMGLEAWA